jgi:K(+)-stimulated pyrophosphate-energized sodium pump
VAILSGTLVGLAIGVATEFYTSASPVRRIAEAGKSGPAAGVLAGLVTGMESAVAPMVLLGAAVGVSFFFAGLYGVGLSAVGMLGTVGTTASLDAYGAVAQGAAGVGGMRRHGAGSELDAFVLDSIGRTTGARCTGFATGAATLTAVALLLAYASAVGIRAGGLDLTYPGVLLGLLLGAALLLFVSSWTLGAVSRAAEGVAEAGRSALRDAIVPAVVVIAMPVAVAYFLGAETLGGLIAGGALGGVLMAFLGSNAGGAWESARRYVEGGALGGKGSDAHRAAEVGEAVGDPFRDVVGPTLGAVVRMVGAVSLALAPWLAGLHRVIQEPATAALLRGLGAVRAFLG